MKRLVILIDGTWNEEGIGNDTNVRAAVFYPSGGLLDTGLWTAQRNRPAELAREKEHTRLGDELARQR